MNKMMKKTLLTFPLLMSLSFSVFAADGVVRVKSANDSATTTEKLVTALKAKGMKIFAQIAHDDGAKSVGLDLRPTKLVIFGNPKVGTHLMKCAQSAAIDMPMKALITEDSDGVTWFSYNDPAYIAKRHGVADCEIVGKMSKALGNFAKVATSN